MRNEFMQLIEAVSYETDCIDELIDTMRDQA